MYAYPSLTLASESPRRTDILNQLAIPHHIFPPHIDERCDIPDPAQRVTYLASKKAEAIRSHVDTDIIVAADTVVALSSHSSHNTYTIFEKPSDAEEAIRMLQALSGRTHVVHTGICVMCGNDLEVSSASSEVTFIEIEHDMLHRYVASDEWQGVAGAYRIQGLGAAFIQSINGNYSTVMGLSIPLLLSLLKPHRR